MKLAIRSHDLGREQFVTLSQKLTEYGLDGVQLVCYKSFTDILYQEGQLSEEKVKAVLEELEGKQTYLIGAYFNPVHSDIEKVRQSIDIFKEYLIFSKHLRCNTVGSETGSYNDDKWTYHPENRTEQALDKVVKVFTELCDYASLFQVNVGIEGAAGHVCYDVSTLEKAVSLIDRKNLQVIFDLYNFLETNNHGQHLEILKEGLKAFKGKICCFHMKDYVLEQDKLVQVPFGKGILEKEQIVKLIKLYDKDAVLVLEGTTGKDIVPAVKIIKTLWGKS